MIPPPTTTTRARSGKTGTDMSPRLYTGKSPHTTRERQRGRTGLAFVGHMMRRERDVTSVEIGFSRTVGGSEASLGQSTPNRSLAFSGVRTPTATQEQATGSIGRLS